MGARRDLISDDGEMQLHCFTVAVRQHKGSASSTLGTDCAEDPARLSALVKYGLRRNSFPGPTISDLVLLAHPHLVFTGGSVVNASISLPSGSDIRDRVVVEAGAGCLAQL